MTDTDAALALAEEIGARLRALPKHDAASLRQVRRALSQRVEACDGRAVLALAVELLHSEAPGRHVVAYELVREHAPAARAVGPAALRRLGAGMSSWGEVDTFACSVAGRAWRAGQVPDTLIARWAKSRDRWWRRAALVSTVPLNVRAQGGTGDAPRTLAICALLIRDRDPMVVKALSWALRELATRDRAAVERFVRRHEQSLAAQVVREVRSKLDTGRKTRRAKP